MYCKNSTTFEYKLVDNGPDLPAFMSFDNYTKSFSFYTTDPVNVGLY
jgi:hypothetical protein